MYRQPEDTWIGIPFPPLVDEQTWDRAQAIKKQRTSLSKRNTKIFYMLQHLLRCAECGLLFACRSKTRATTKYKDRKYIYNLETPQRHYHCYGMQRERLRCRERPYIRADRLEELVWSEVKKVVQNPDLILEGIESLDTQEDGGLAKRIASAKRALRRIQMEGTEPLACMCQERSPRSSSTFSAGSSSNVWKPPGRSSTTTVPRSRWQ